MLVVVGLCRQQQHGRSLTSIQYLNISTDFGLTFFRSAFFGWKKWRARFFVFFLLSTHIYSYYIVIL